MWDPNFFLFFIWKHLIVMICVINKTLSFANRYLPFLTWTTYSYSSIYFYIIIYVCNFVILQSFLLGPTTKKVIKYQNVHILNTIAILYWQYLFGLSDIHVSGFTFWQRPWVMNVCFHYTSFSTLLAYSTGRIGSFPLVGWRDIQ